MCVLTAIRFQALIKTTAIMICAMVCSLKYFDASV